MEQKRGGGDRRTVSLIRIMFCIILIVLSVLLSFHEGKNGEKQEEEKVTAKIAPSASPTAEPEDSMFPAPKEAGQESDISASPIPESEMSAETYGRASTVVIQNGECLDKALDVHGNSILGTRIREFLNGFDSFVTVNMVQIDAKTLYAGEGMVSFYADMYEGESGRGRLFCSYDFSDFVFAIEKQ